MRKAKASVWMIGVTLLTVTVLAALPITPKVAVTTTVVGMGTLIRTISTDAVIGYADRQTIVALCDGQIESVAVSAGDRVKRGELLAVMDSSAEEASLARLTALKAKRSQAFSAVGEEAVSALAAQTDAELELQTAQLQAVIAAKALRAQADGVLEQAYIADGDYVAAATPVMLLHGDTFELTANLRLQDSLTLADGCPASVSLNGKVIGTATLTRFSAPSAADGQYTQSATFSCAEALDGHVGESARLAIFRDAHDACALVPVSAVDSRGRCWIVCDGKARAVPIDASLRNDDYVGAEQSLAGERVILLPDERLYDGCPVKEAKR